MESRPLAARWFRLVVVQAVLAAGVLAASAWAQPAAPAAATGPRFADPPADLRLSPAMLSSAEREFIAAHPVVRVAIARADWAPFQTLDAAGHIGGHAIQTLVAAAGTLGLRLEPVLFDDWTGVLAALRERRADVIPYAGYDDARAAYLAFTLGIARDPSALIGRADTPLPADNPGLRKRRVAVPDGYVQHAALGTLYPQAVPVVVRGDVEGLKAVADRKADFYLGPLLPALHQLRSAGSPALEVKAQVLSGSGWSHIAVRSDWPMLARMLSRVISGERQRLATQPMSAAAPALGAAHFSAPLALSGDELDLLDRTAVLRVGAVRGLHALNDFGASGGHSGIAAEFTAQVAHSLGVPVHVEPFDSVAQMLQAARAGTIDLVPLLTKTPGRTDEFVFSQPYFRMPYLLVARTDAPLYWDLGSLAGKRLALAREHPLIPILRDKYPDVLPVLVDNGEQALDAVAAGEADAAVEIKLYANQVITLKYPSELRAVESIADLPADFAFAAPRASAALIPLVDRALQALPHAEARRIGERWVAADLEPVRRMQQVMRTLLPIGSGLAVIAALLLLWNRQLVAETRRRRAVEQRLVDMTDRLSTGVYQYRMKPDCTVELIFANQALRRMLRLADGATSLPELAILEHVGAADRMRVAAAWAHARDTGEPFSEVFRFVFPDGREGWLSARFTSRTAVDGTLVWSGYLVDLTEERTMQQRLRALLQAKNLFIATASHELKSPLFGISLTLQRLIGARSPGPDRQGLELALRSTHELGELIDDLLDLTMMEAGRLTLHEAPLAVAALVDGVAAAFEPARQNKGLALEVRLAPDLPAAVQGDELRLRQVLTNLIGNAVKYSDAGSVRVAVDRAPAATGESASPADGARCTLVFEVADSGPGIPADRLATIFEPFSEHPGNGRRIDAGERVAPGAGSTGLGLSISKRLVELMGGEIGVRSEPGEGTRVTVRIPFVTVDPAAVGAADGGAAGTVAGAASVAVAQATPVAAGSSAPAAGMPPAAAPAAEAGADALAGLRLLLVDDDRFSRTMMAGSLSDRGAVVTEADSAEEALQSWEHGLYDVLITDLRMPGMNGTELVAALRARDARGRGNRPLRCVALSASTRLVDVDGKAGPVFDCVMLKPVRLELLIDAIRALVR